MALLAAVVLAQLELPPLPEPSPVPPPERVHVRLNAVPANAQLYDLDGQLPVCRAPCGVWLDVGQATRYRVDAEGVRSSSEFGFDELSPGSSVLVDYTPRDELLRSWALGLTIFGGIGVGGGAVLAVVWVVILAVVNVVIGFFTLFLGGPFTGWVGLVELLYVAAVAVPVGAPALAVGIPLLARSRERLDVREERPPTEAVGGR